MLPAMRTQGAVAARPAISPAVLESVPPGLHGACGVSGAALPAHCMQDDTVNDTPPAKPCPIQHSVLELRHMLLAVKTS